MTTTNNIEDILARGLDQMSLIEVEQVTPKMGDELIAKELYQLSTEERHRVLNDLHGVADIVEEEPAVVEECLGRLESELAKIPTKTAYVEALEQSSDHVLNRDFRLMFLRADRFGAKDAAARMVLYFESKKKLFGSEKLAKKILLEDLDDETMACLESGYMNLLPGRDRAGRAVFMGVSILRKLTSEQGLVRQIDLGKSALEPVLANFFLCQATSLLVCVYGSSGRQRNSETGDCFNCLFDWCESIGAL
jgi:hypothetical protein